MHPSILRNTLISKTGVRHILSLPREECIYASVSEVMSKFQDMKKFASEIHTEIHLIKPILKIFGYVYESKPKFFETNIKGPDVALFATEDSRVATSPLWGTKEYYDNTLGILLLKRYGRTLDKGIGGFYLEFENKIPVYQTIYLLKKAKTPWGILTNGRNWILIKRPVNFEKRLIEIDIEASLSEGVEETLHLFYHIFSLKGLKNNIPDMLEDERNKLIPILKEKRTYARNSIQGLKRRSDIYQKIISTCKAFLPNATPSLTETCIQERRIKREQGEPGASLWIRVREAQRAGHPRAGAGSGATCLPDSQAQAPVRGSWSLFSEHSEPGAPGTRTLVGVREAEYPLAGGALPLEGATGYPGDPLVGGGVPAIATAENGKREQSDMVNAYDASEVFSYLFTKKGCQTDLNLEEILLYGNEKHTKEDLLSTKILDMTPGFGTLTIRILEELAYLAFVLPYKGRNTFVAEWEDEHTLKRYILNNILHGVERSQITFDMFQNTMRNRFDTAARHYKSGNPLIGMSIKDISGFFDSKNQMGLFNRDPGEIIHDFREAYKRYFTLSDSIKEDAELKNEIEIKLKTYRERIRDTLDVITSTYFTKSVENRKVQDILFNLESSESTWEILRKRNWYIESKGIAERNGFFHFEIEFPFLLKSAFDFILVQPALSYIWEEEPPFVEATKAYIKSGIRYLKPDGKLIICAENAENTLLPELEKSRKYSIEIKSGVILLSRKTPEKV